MKIEDDKIILIELGQKVRKERKKRKLTQKALADLIGAERARISDLERAQRDIQYTTLVKIIWALDLEPNNLIPFQKIEEEDQKIE